MPPRIIKTHVSRSMQEIAQLVAKSGGFTAPLGLPHYRYDRTRQNIKSLVEFGILRPHKRHDIHHAFVPGEAMPEWLAAGCPSIMPWGRERRKASKQSASTTA